MRKIPVIIFLACIFLFSISSLAYSSVDVVLKLYGIEGESNVDKHEDEIDVLTWSWEVGNTFSFSGEMRGSKSIIEPLTVRKYVDKASPNLILASLNGDHIPEAILTVIDTWEDKPIDYLKITMKNVKVINVSNGGDSDNYRPTEDVELVFSKVCFAYTPRKLDGSVGEVIVRCWDVVGNFGF